MRVRGELISEIEFFAVPCVKFFPGISFYPLHSSPFVALCAFVTADGFQLVGGSSCKHYDSLYLIISFKVKHYRADSHDAYTRD